jgi:phage terminase large subunit-like protein
MTAGDDAENRPGKREEDYAKQILDGDVIDERYFVMIRQVPASESPHDKSKWAWANPMLRYPDEYSKKLLQQTESEYVAAYGSMDPDKIRKFLTRRLCQWQTAAVNSYLNDGCLELARKAMISRKEFAELTNGRACWCGFDLGKRIDLSGVAAVFILDDGRVAIKMHGFMPENGVTRHEHTDKVPYADWISRTFVTATPGDVTDNSWVWDWIKKHRQSCQWDVKEVDYDGHNATDLAIQMCEEENREDFCVEIRQTCAGQNMAVKGFRELLLQGKIVLEYSPLAIWCLKNAIEVTNNFGDSKLSKKHKDDSQRIDPLAAAMNALARALIFREKPSLERAVDSNYEM